MAELVSVVIPVHNGERFLATAVRSVLWQDHKEIELIVVDDGSSDKGLSLARALAPTATYMHFDGVGVAAARNAGSAAANGSWLAFLDQDDIWTPDRLSTALAEAGKGDVILSGEVSFSLEGER